VVARPKQDGSVRSVYDPRYVEMIARLRAVREQKGLSQTELAQRLGKPQSYVSKAETCERRIDLIEALEFCEALGIGIAAIIPSELKRLLYEEESNEYGR
jgi:transcriptional regulator with XRE-family HTH domain